MHFPPAGLPQSVRQLRPFVCLNAGADKGNPLLLQSLALALLQVRLGYDGRHTGQFDEACLDSLKVGESRVP